MGFRLLGRRFLLNINNLYYWDDYLIMKKIKYALVGFGGIAENRIAKEGFACDKSRFNGLKHAELVGAMDLNPKRQAAAEALGLKWYNSQDEIINDKEIEAAFVATNNLSHAAIAKQLLLAGKHVIVEKPISTSIADAAELIKIAAERKLSLSVDHMMVNNAWNVKIKDLVAANAIGAVNDGCFHMEFAYGYDPAESATWRCSSVAEMGGPIGDVASHCMYVAEYILQSPIVKLAAVYLPKLMPTKVEDGAYIKFTMANGISASVKVAFSELRGGLSGTLTNLGFEIYGSEATIRSYGSMFQLSGHPGEPIKIRAEIDKLGEVETIQPAEIKNIYQQLVEHHAESIQTGQPINAQDALHNLELCAAAHESAQHNGKLIEVAK